MKTPTTAHTYRIPAILTLIAIAAILAFSAVITVSAQSDDPDWRLPVTGLTVTTGDDAGELDIAWDHHTQTTKTFLNYRVAWTPEGESFKRANQTDWNVFTTSNQHNVTGLDAGETYQVKVRTRYEGNQGSRWTDVVTGQSGAATNTTPVNTPATGQPTIAGTPEVGETLTAATSSISDGNGLANANFAYQWIRSADGSDTRIPGATGSTYLISDKDLGHSIKVQVSFTDDDGYSETLTSDATTTVPEPTSQNNAATGQPTASGTAEVGETLTAGTSDISDENGLTNSTFNYQWVRSADGTDTDISGATDSSYSLSADDLQHTIKVQVSFTDDDGYSETLTSQATDVVVTTPNVAATGQPTIAGTVEARETLTAATSAIADDNGLTNAVFSHQWVRSANGSDADITNATGSTYVVTNADVDNAIKVRVSFTDDDGYSETLTSSATTSVPVPTPVIVPPEEPQIAQASHDVLVSNTGKATDPNFNLLVGSSSGNKYSQAQQFTTGDNEDEYTLSSVQIYIKDFGGSDAARVSIYEADSSGKPNSSLYQLTNPSPFANNSLNTFTAPANATLAKETKYLVVAEATSGLYKIGYTSSTSEDSGKANGWSINNQRHNRDSDSGSWSLSPIGNTNIRISVSGTITPSTDIMVPDTWSLKPSGLGVGDKFRLIFLSSTKRNASSDSIGNYNTFIQDRAAAGHADIQAYSDGFTVVGCTAAKDARDNTATTFTSSDKGIPIYWLNGNKVADEYEDFYDGSWDDEANDKNELGANGPNTSQSANYPFTGCNHNGTEAANNTVQPRGLGSNFGTRLGRPNSSGSGHGPLDGGDSLIGSTRPMYGLSAILRVVEAEEGPTLVSNNWSLTPSELGARDQFRLLFLSSTTRNATSSDIEDYNTFVQNRAAAGHTDIQAYSNGFKVVGCTAAIDARDNTSTTYTSFDKGVPIYWLGGTKVADQYQDFYDGSWDNATNTHDRDELGINSTNTSQSGNRPWTGCGENGTEAIFSGVSYPLGNTQSGTGDPATNNPLQANIIADNTNLRPMYGLSQLFEVPPDATLGDLVIEGAANSESISLSPTFDDDTFTYTAAVPTGIDAVRLTATTNDSNSTVAITGDDDTGTPNTADFDLDLGANTLSLTVTAEDGTTQTYTITVTRLGTPPPPATVTANWSLTPDGVSGGQQFRLIFYSSTKRDAQSDNIEDYNTFVQDRAAAGHAAIRQYSDGFTAVGCTEDADARDNTQTRYTDSNTGVPIYWLGGLKVADNYRDFYDGSWNNEANDQDRNEVGNTGPDSSQAINYPWTGCDHDGTEAFLASGDSVALGNTNGNNVRMGKPGSTVGTDGPLNGDQEEDPADSLPMYGLSQVFTVLPGNTGTLTTGGTPRSETLGSSDTGHYWQVWLHKNVKYRIDVKGSESSQYGGTINNPWLRLVAGSDHIKLLNGSSAGVSQTGTGTEATSGGTGQNSRLDIKVLEAGDQGQYYHLLVHSADNDNGSYTVTVNRLDWPQGRLAPDITLTNELLNTFGIQWLEPAKTHNDISAPISGYHIQRRSLPNGSWGATTVKTAGQLSHSWPGLTPGLSYEVRVRSYHSNEHPNNTYRWGYATLYTDDCAISGTDTCSIAVNASKSGRINYTAGEDLDGYTVRLTSGRTYVIRANGKSNGAGSLVDPKLVLRRASDNSNVGNDNNGGQGLNAKLTYTPTSTEDYLIHVSSNVAGERGSYRVKVTEQ